MGMALCSASPLRAQSTIAVVELGPAVCGPLTNGYGPFDFRKATAAQRDLVESAHFTTEVELLVRGKTSENIGHDIDYTLRAFPNNPRALISMSRLSLREKRSTPRGAQYSIDCYLERAMRFQPDDPMPPMVAGVHYAQMKQRDKALGYLQRASLIADGDPNLHYNLALGYLEAGDLDASMRHARIAYAAGYPLPGLRDRLRAAGAWRDTQ